MTHIFRSYDIRGIYGSDLTDDIMRRIGMSFAAFSKKDVVLSRDSRLSSPALSSAFASGASSAGTRVIDAGISPMGAGMFHAWKSGTEFAYITGSHLPKEWGGVKFFHANGIGFKESENAAIRDIFLNNSVAEKNGSVENAGDGVVDSYVNYLNDRIKSSRRLSIVVDNGNGVSSIVSRKLFSRAGHELDVIFEEPDGNFPNRLPDPIDRELGKLKKIVSNYDIGIAYDGDSDRMAVVDEKGHLLSAEQTSYIILSKLMGNVDGPIVANVECTRLIDDIAGRFSRKVIRAPVGHTFLMQYVNDNSACYGVEPTGHYCIPSIVPFDDAVTISLYMVSAVSEAEETLSEMVKEMPAHGFERLSFECPDSIKFDVMAALKEKIMKRFGNAITIDGVRVDMENGWSLLRVSNTSPYIRLTIEGSTRKDSMEIRKEFVGIMKEEFDSRGLEMKEEHGKK